MFLALMGACSGGSKDDAGETTSFAVGAKPWSVALDEGRGLLYAANEFDNTVSVVDLDSGEVLAVVDSGTGPGAIAVDESSGRAYVANAFSNDVTVLESADVVEVLTAGQQPWDIAVGDAGLVYVANSGAGTVSVAGEEAVSIDGFGEPWGVAVSSDGNTLYVADAATDEVVAVALDEGNAVRARGTTGDRPRGIALDEEAGRLYVANTETANVTVLSLPDLSPVATVEVGLAPLAVAVNPSRGHAYVVNSLGDTMSVIDTISNTVVATLDAGSKPWDVTVSTDRSTVYVAASASGEILLFKADDLVVSPD